ncbi:MAG: lytic transglycosylase domain-containing protein [Syntrophobacteraceae bacterium]|nr:lytic transglycosylase domain-containing protein [Syntrophobacteraceae bacterium]
MAPDSSLYGLHAAGTDASLRGFFVKLTALVLLSQLIFPFAAQAGSENMDNPGPLASLSVPGDSLNAETPPMTSILPVPAGPAKGTAADLWRNRIQIPINEPLVKKYIRFYEGSGRRTFSVALSKAGACLPEMAEILESRGVPGELVSIVFVESGFKGSSESYRGAGGYWQLLPATAREMGLRVNRWVDERFDPVKSTKAAAKYLSKLHEQYDSWLLAIAAYNAGTMPARCVAGKCRVKDGMLYGRRLPAYSAVYVSKVLAAMDILREPEKYGFRNPHFCRPTAYDPVLVTSSLSLERVAQWVDVPVGRLKELNPSLRQDTMSPSSGFALRLPPGTRDKFDLAYEVYSGR